MHLAKGSLFKGAALLLSAQALACSRVTYHANVDQRITVGRSMDFVASTNSSIYVFPAGMQRNGSTKENPITWTAKYGSMITTMYDHVSTDGMNSAGLTGSLLFLGVSDYGQRNNSSPGLAIGFWLQYFLDQFATVAEVADAIQHTDMQVVPAAFVPGVTSTGHISLSDKSGDNLILEYLNGQLVMHHGQQYSVMTNDPAFDDQIALNTYWTPIANVSLPGTQSPAGKSQKLIPRSCEVLEILIPPRSLRKTLILQPDVTRVTRSDIVHCYNCSHDTSSQRSFRPT